MCIRDRQIIVQIKSCTCVHACAHTHTHTPVSYTHLDVYKRQISTFINSGKEQTQANNSWSVPTRSVLRSAEPLFHTYRNIIRDNWFSSIDLLDVLKWCDLTYVGTMCKNKREILKQFLPEKSRPIESSIFGFVQEKTSVSYVPKKNKAVVLVSSMHRSSQVYRQSSKPAIIEFYNSTKIIIQHGRPLSLIHI